MRWSAWTAMMCMLAACGGGGTGLTTEQLETASSDVHAFQPWSEAKPKLTEALGEPHATAAGSHTWYATTDDGCTALTVTTMGDNVGTVGIADADCP